MKKLLLVLFCALPTIVLGWNPFKSSYEKRIYNAVVKKDQEKFHEILKKAKTKNHILKIKKRHDTLSILIKDNNEKLLLEYWKNCNKEIQSNHLIASIEGGNHKALSNFLI